MKNKFNADLEQSFQQRKEALYDFYKHDTTRLSDEEAASITPIYNSLTEAESRYGEQTLIAEGGEKRVYRTYDRRLDRFVAMAYAVNATMPEEEEQFLREARLTANLIHPNIVPIHNMGITDEGIPFFSMELVPGDSLNDILTKLHDAEKGYHEKYPLDALLAIYLKVCDAVAYAHSREVLHLDIKPDNIRVGQFGEVLLCDWGLARVIHEEETETPPGQLDGDVLNDMTLTGIMKGTPGFMAPELTVHNGERTRQTDIYSLGAVLYKILTYEIPVSGASANEVLENTRAGKIIPARKRRPDKNIPRGLAAVAMKALELEPANRYDSVPALQAEIHRFLTGFPTEVERAGPLDRLSLLAQRHRDLTLGMLFFFAILSVVISLNLLIIQKKKEEAIAAQQVAEKNFELFLAKEKEAEALDATLDEASLLTAKSKDVLHPESRLRLLNKVDLTGMKPPEARNILIRKGNIEFMLQQFNAAISTYEQLGEDPEIRPLLELAQQYAAIKPNDSTFLRDSELAELLTHRKVVMQSMAYFLYHYHITRKTIRTREEYLPLASIMLGRVNLLHDDTIVRLQLSKREKGWHLDLSDTLYATYSVPITGAYRKHILTPLWLHSLDISHTPVALVKEFRNLWIKELRMVGVAFEPKDDLPNMLKAMGIKKVILGKGEYPESILTEIRAKGIEVVEEKSEP
jgi:serine/threonine protein kinase